MPAGTVGTVKDDGVADLLGIGTDDIRPAECRCEGFAGFIFADDRLREILIDVVEDFLGSLA